VTRASSLQWIALSAFASALLPACTPKVAVEAPKEPIVINMNIKIDHEIKVKVDEDLDQAIADDKEIF
jgi:hypothetical protein